MEVCFFLNSLSLSFTCFSRRFFTRGSLCRVLSRLLCGFSLSIAFLCFLGFSVSHLSLFILLVVVCSSHLALLLQVSPSSTASACHRLRMLSLFCLPASFGDTVLFSCPLLLLFMLFLFPEWKFASFLTLSLSLSLVSLGASLPGVLSVYYVCLRSAWGPSSSFTDSSFLFVIIMFTFFSSSVFRSCDFVFIPLLSPLVVISKVFRSLPSLGIISSVPMGCSLL